jgi:hypothetical protein
MGPATGTAVIRQEASRSAAGKLWCKHLTCGVHTVGPSLTPRRPLGCIFPEVWFEDTELQYMDADRGHSSYKRSL